MTDQTTTTKPERPPRDAWRDEYRGRLAGAAAEALRVEPPARPSAPAPEARTPEAGT